MEHKVFGEEELIRQKTQRLLDAYSLEEILEISECETIDALYYLIDSGLIDPAWFEYED